MSQKSKGGGIGIKLIENKVTPVIHGHLDETIAHAEYEIYRDGQVFIFLHNHSTVISSLSFALICFMNSHENRKSAAERSFCSGFV